MARVFADAVYFIALLLPRDRLHDAAVSAWRRVNPLDLVTCDPVLVELLAHVSALGAETRASAVDTVDALRADLGERLVRQTPELFDEGLELYRRRLDKGYSLTDCMAMVICRRLGITDVLTHDDHFRQEGFRVLL